MSQPIEWYFVRQKRSGAFAVQVLNADGQSIEEGEISPDATEATIAGRSIPRPVLEAAKQRKPGDGQYIDAAGQHLDLWGRPVAA